MIEISVERLLLSLNGIKERVHKLFLRCFESCHFIFILLQMNSLDI